MPLILEIEHLLGVAFAARMPASGQPDWPPQPDRVFSALVATWAARGEKAEERRALEWLERQEVPEIAASGGAPREAPTVFVPPNDPETRRTGDRSVMPAFRRRQPRRFPAYRPDDPVVRLIWPNVAADPATFGALNALAADTSYVGHSASLTRCRFLDRIAGISGPQTGRTRRRVYPGRLAELERRFHSGQRPSPGEAVRADPQSESDPTPRSVFSDEWLVLEHVDGEMPDLRAAALVAKALRDTIMSGYREIELGHAIPEIVSGHMPDGTPTPKPHLAIVPLAFLGSRYASGAVFGFALVPPREANLLADPTFQRAMRRIMRANDDNGRRELRCYGPGIDVRFSIPAETPRASLNPAPYIRTGKVWASCTPVVLDRHLKETGTARDAEVAALVAQACANIGLPAPVNLAAGKHSAIEGAVSAYPSGNAPRWANWNVPPALASRQRMHLVVEFKEAVTGPVILGAGRFVGLGLMRPLDARADGEP